MADPAWQVRKNIDLEHTCGHDRSSPATDRAIFNRSQLCGAQGSSLKEKVTSNHTQVQKRLTSSRTMATSPDFAAAAKLDDASKQRCLNLARTLSDHAQLPAHCQVNRPAAARHSCFPLGVEIPALGQGSALAHAAIVPSFAGVRARPGEHEEVI